MFHQVALLYRDYAFGADVNLYEKLGFIFLLFILSSRF